MPNWTAIASRSRRTLRGRPALAALGGLLATLALLVIGCAPAWAAGGVTITTSFENDPISVNTTDAVGYALTNTTASAQTVTFTDALPAGVTLDNPTAAALTNGSTSGCNLVPPAAGPGATSVTVTVTVPPATGTACTVWFDVVASTPSNDQTLADAYTGLSASSVKPVATPGGLIVLSDPTLSFTSPVNGQTFSLGEIVDANFSCAASDPLDSIDSFFGTDDEGNQIESGGPIDTVDPGTHTLEVDCYSAAGGGYVSQTVSYSVSSYTLLGVHAARGTDQISYRTLVPAGQLFTRVFYGSKLIALNRTAVSAQGIATVSFGPTAAGRRLIGSLRGRFATLSLQVSFEPQAIGSGEQQITPVAAIVTSRQVKVPLLRPAPPQGKRRRVRPRSRRMRPHSRRVRHRSRRVRHRHQLRAG
jgi:hypothetical protein